MKKNGKYSRFFVAVVVACISITTCLKHGLICTNTVLNEMGSVKTIFLCIKKEKKKLRSVSLGSALLLFTEALELLLFEY